MFLHAVLFTNEVKNLTNVAIGKLCKLVHKQNCSHDFKKKKHSNIIIVEVRYITLPLKQKTLPVLDIPHSYSAEDPGATQFDLHLSTDVEIEIRYTQYEPLLFFCSSTVSYT